WDIARSNSLTDRALAVDARHVRAIVERAFSNVCRRGASSTDRSQSTGQFEFAIRLDPLNSWAAALHGFGLSSMGRHPEAVAEARRAIELDPAAFTGRWSLVWALAGAERRGGARCGRTGVPDV